MRPCWFLLIAIAVTACGGAARTAAPPAPEGAAEADSLDAIDHQFGQLRRWYAELGLQPVPRGLGSWCPAASNAPPTAVCTDRCEVTDHLCEGARAVCAQASRLDGHAWADGKCDQARSMCRDARHECCACDGPAASHPLIL